MVTPREGEYPRLSALSLADASGYQGNSPTVLEKRNFKKRQRRGTTPTVTPQEGEWPRPAVVSLAHASGLEGIAPTSFEERNFRTCAFGAPRQGLRMGREKTQLVASHRMGIRGTRLATSACLR